MIIGYCNTENGYFSLILLRLLLFLLLFNLENSQSQTLPVGISEGVEDLYRRSQLLNEDTGRFSYLIRPIDINHNHTTKQTMTLLPLLWRQQFNSHHPHGMNDGAMIPGNGYQTMVSAGVFLKYGPLSVQLRPEFVFAQNKDYRELHETNNGAGFQNAVASHLNRIDLPSRFGSGTYSKPYWGQSSIRLTFDPVSIGLSTENLWWGPGRYNSLLMSNNAPGFKHITLNTSRPVETGIGRIEAQLIGARLEGSEIAKLPGAQFYEKPDDWRYLSGIVVTYQPKWLKGLSVGFDRTFMIYRGDMGSSFGDYFPLFSSLAKNSFSDEDLINSEDEKDRDQNFSLFARWVMSESRMEVYAQYGRTDFSWDLRDLFVEPEHSRAYIIGFRKLMALRGEDEYIDAGIELTQMEGSNTGLLRDQPSWYMHSRVPAGYTHMGQVLGAGIGPESNMQTLELSWVKGLKRVGLVIDHLVHNYGLSRTVSGERKSWTDVAVTGRCDWTYRDFVMSGKLAVVRSANYLYENKENNPNNMVNNLHLQLGILYNL